METKRFVDDPVEIYCFLEITEFRFGAGLVEGVELCPEFGEDGLRACEMVKDVGEGRGCGVAACYDYEGCIAVEPPAQY